MLAKLRTSLVQHSLRSQMMPLAFSSQRAATLTQMQMFEFGNLQ